MTAPVAHVGRFDDLLVWQSLLPSGTVWFGGGNDVVLPVAPMWPCGQTVAFIARRGWIGRAQTATIVAGLDDVRAYVALPSAKRPLIVAARDPSLLRYVTASLLSAPPGTGVPVGLLCEVGLRLLRIPGVWELALAAGMVRTILVGRVG